MKNQRNSATFPFLLCCTTTDSRESDATFSCLPFSKQAHNTKANSRPEKPLYSNRKAVLLLSKTTF